MQRILLTGAVAALPWFVVWQCLAQIANVYHQLLIGMDDVKNGCVIISLGHLLAVALSIPLVASFGLLGIALAFIASTLFTMGMAAIRLHSKCELTVSRATPVVVIFAAVGLLAAAMLARNTAEFTIVGVGLRFLISLVFLSGLWVALPKLLRSEPFYRDFSKVEQHQAPVRLNLS